MDIIIKEIKAYCKSHDNIEAYLLQQKAEFKGLDIQEDTYFKVEKGRMKLRIGSTEKNLIWYYRKELQGVKHSEVKLFPVKEDIDALKDTLLGGLEILVTVKKFRKIYFIDNVKFHLDTIEELGRFVEIEAIGENGKLSEDELKKQVQFYIKQFRILKNDMIAHSYSDMILDKKKEVRSNQRTS